MIVLYIITAVLLVAGVALRWGRKKLERKGAKQNEYKLRSGQMHFRE